MRGQLEKGEKASSYHPSRQGKGRVQAGCKPLLGRHGKGLASGRDRTAARAARKRVQSRTGRVAQLDGSWLQVQYSRRDSNGEEEGQGAGGTLVHVSGTCVRNTAKCLGFFAVWLRAGLLRSLVLCKQTPGADPRQRAQGEGSQGEAGVLPGRRPEVKAAARLLARGRLEVLARRSHVGPLRLCYARPARGSR